jgi:hypothetical protein
MKIGLVTIQKNRAPWVHEWLAFHKVVGFTNFYFYAHNCTDGTDQVVNQLAQTYNLKSFSLNTFENQVQLKVYQHAYENFAHECDWLACFGSSGHIEEPSGLMIENYRRRPDYGFEINRHIKSIVRGRQSSRVGPNAHMFVTPWGTQDELGRPIDFGLTKYAPSFSRFRINHYVCQSYQYFKQSKQGSGAADAGAGYVRPDTWWTKHDHNDEHDDSLEHLYAAVRREVQRVPLVQPAPSSLLAALPPSGLQLPS